MNQNQSILTIAIEAAQEAGKILNHYYGKSFEISEKVNAGLVTEADKASEEKIISIIKKAFPTHSILAEESGLKDMSSDTRWVIDPLDGTTNFAHQIPFFCVSIGVEVKGAVTVAVVFDSLRNELYTAIKNEGAYCNGKKLHVSKTQKIHDALFATGFAYQKGVTLQEQIAFLGPFLEKSHGIRRTGSAVWDFCQVAKGHFDGFWEKHLHPWDVAAGMLMVQEAGGKISRYNNTPATIYDHEIVASNGHIHQEMISILKPEN